MAGNAGIVNDNIWHDVKVTRSVRNYHVISVDGRNSSIQGSTANKNLDLNGEVTRGNKTLTLRSRAGAKEGPGPLALPWRRPYYESTPIPNRHAQTKPPKPPKRNPPIDMLAPPINKLTL